MTSSLRPYQQEGLSWLKNRESGGKKRGGILGDDVSELCHFLVYDQI